VHIYKSGFSKPQQYKHLFYTNVFVIFMILHFCKQLKLQVSVLKTNLFISKTIFFKYPWDIHTGEVGAAQKFGTISLKFEGVVQ